MDDAEQAKTTHNHKHPGETLGEVSCSVKGLQHLNLQGQHEFKAVVPKSIYGSLESKSYHEDNELSAVDLRISKPSMINSPGGSIEYYENKKYSDRMAHLFKNVNSSDLYFNVSSGSQIDTPSRNSNYTISNLESYTDDFNQASHNHCTSYHKINPKKQYTFKNISSGVPDLVNAENHADFVLLVDQETQTQMKESKEASVQTDKESYKSTNSLLRRKNLSNLNYCCLICQCYYTSKSSYDRHERTHVTNGNVITNFQHVTKKAKLMILGENICKSQTRCVDLPIILQEPKLTKFRCGTCSKSFSSQVARDFHRGNCVLEDFPLQKCKECHVQFFTLGALNEHVKVVHDKSNKKCTTYCCIFCNASFESSYSFQLHLDEHLSTQMNI